MEHALQTINLADILERVLDKGIVIAGDITISLVESICSTSSCACSLRRSTRPRSWASIGGRPTLSFRFTQKVSSGKTGPQQRLIAWRRSFRSSPAEGENGKRRTRDRLRAACGFADGAERGRDVAREVRTRRPGHRGRRSAAHSTRPIAWPKPCPRTSAAALPG